MALKREVELSVKALIVGATGASCGQAWEHDLLTSPSK